MEAHPKVFCVNASAVNYLRWHNDSAFANRFKLREKGYRIYPKYLDTVNVRTRYFFLKRHLFYVPYISGHVHNGIFAVRKFSDTKKRVPYFS